MSSDGRSCPAAVLGQVASPMGSGADPVRTFPATNGLPLSSEGPFSSLAKWTSGPREEPGIPPSEGLLARSSIGETERNTWYPMGPSPVVGAIHTAYAFPWLSRAIHGKINGLASVIWVTCQAAGSW